MVLQLSAKLVMNQRGVDIIHAAVCLLWLLEVNRSVDQRLFHEAPVLVGFKQPVQGTAMFST